MPDQSTHIIQALTNKWSRNNLVAAVFNSIAVSAPLATLAHYGLHLSEGLTTTIFLLIVTVVFLLRKPRKLTPDHLASFLNHSYPQLEESTQLLLQPSQSLSLLQQMQVNKIGPVLQTIPPPAAMSQGLIKSSIMLVGSLSITAILAALASLLPANAHPFTDDASIPVPKVQETVLPGITQYSIQVTPPAYTGRQPRQQQQFTLKVEAGSHLQWDIHTNQPVEQLQLVFNARDTVQLQPANSDSTSWILQKDIIETGFYQVVLGGQASQLYTLEAIPDQPVDILIVTPAQYSAIEPGRAPVAKLSVQLTDDYGIRQAVIIATKASGKGESVSFQEQQLTFSNTFDNRREMLLNKQLDLHALGLKAGDELYFYIKAIDNHNQESRSDMYFISLPDTAELLSMSGLESGISQVPEYFRSQRQIIIDIEKLLQQQATIPKDSFNARSNVLGDDQKLLRLRYGKFVGEEWESGGHHPGDGHDHANEKEGHDEKKEGDKEDDHHEEQTVPIGDIKAIEDQYAHKHDNAEDATYLEPAQKAQLKNILTEMWSSELKLRTYYPREALPYAYKALRLLKDMQQKSRAYVSKTSVKMPPLKPEKRLTGELDKISDPATTKQSQAPDNTTATLETAIGLLEQLKQGQQISAASMPALTVATQRIAEQAIRAPADYLPALNAIRSITAQTSKPSIANINKVQAALVKLAKPVNSLPQKQASAPAGSLSDAYYKHLQSSRP